MRDLGNARTVVDRGDAERVEPGHIGPAQLGPYRPADSLGKGRGGRLGQAGPGPAGRIDDRHRPRSEHRTHVLGRLVFRAVRREPVVDGHHALVRHHVPGHPALDEDGVQPLAILQPVDHWCPRLVAAQHVEHRSRRVDRVRAHPGPGRVRPLARHGHVGPQRALAAALDAAVGRLQQDREVAGQEVGLGSAHNAEPVTGRLDLLAVVEHVGHVVHRLRHRRGQPQLHGDAGLHVRGPASVQPAVGYV